MKLLEATAKQILNEYGLRTPRGSVVSTSTQAAEVVDDIGPSMIKAQIPAGGRGKAGGVQLATDFETAGRVAGELLGSVLEGHVVETVLVEEFILIADELYVSVLIDTALGCPVVMASRHGGIDVESHPDQMESVRIDAGADITAAGLDVIVASLGHDSVSLRDAVLNTVRAFNELQATLVEINPLVLTTSGEVIAVDAKIETDDSAPPPQLASAQTSTEQLTPLEAAAADRGLRLIELGGSVAILANGAGLTMTTMDAVSHHGGEPANFLEIGGDAYTLAEPALELVLSQVGVRSLLVNFCGAFARCDVMTEGVVNALQSLQPNLPVFFSIHGTGQDEAREMVRSRLGVEPFETMHDAVVAAVQAAR